MQEFKERLENGQTISGCKIDWYLTIEFDKIAMNYRGQLRFAHCYFPNGANILHLKSSEEYFTLVFDHCVFEHTGLNVRFLELANIKIEYCTTTSIGISDSKVDIVEVQSTECTDSCGIYRGEVRTFKLSHDKSCNFGLVHLNSPQLDFTQIRCLHEIKRVYINNAREVWLRGKIGEVDLTEKFESLEILNIWDEDQKEYVNAHIEELKFLYRTFHGDIFVRDAHIESLNFSELHAPTARVQFKEVTIRNAKIEDCSIRNMTWNQLEFKEPPSVSGTDFLGLKMSNVKWPQNKELATSFLKERIPLLFKWRKRYLAKEDQFDEANVSSLKYDIETYRQLKAASKANDNQIEALDFYRNEMKLYWKLIRIEGGIPWYDRLLVFVNRWSSDFGQNWFLPLLWMFLFAILFYSCILDWDFFGNNWSGEEEFGQFWILFNPVHKTPDYITTGYGHFTEFVMRVFTGYFIYHFVRASRKFGKV